MPAPSGQARFYAGVDLGSSYTKAVVIDAAGAVAGRAVVRTGISFEEAGQGALAAALASAGVDRGSVLRVAATGVGRGAFSPAALTKTEIACFARGAWHLYPREGVVIDIGGQDNKVIRMTADGRQQYFKMNRKCAAGTGAFLEEISHRLDTPIARMNDLALAAREPVEIGSYCTVFTATEIVHHIRGGRSIEGIVRGVYESVVKRLLEMDPVEAPAVLTGGAVANNPALVAIFRERLAHGVDVPADPQVVGALGAALYARAGGTGGAGDGDEGHRLEGSC